MSWLIGRSDGMRPESHHPSSEEINVHRRLARIACLLTATISHLEHQKNQDYDILIRNHGVRLQAATVTVTRLYNNLPCAERSNY